MVPRAPERHPPVIHTALACLGLITSFLFLSSSLQTSLVAQWQRICLPMQETRVQSLGQNDPLEKEMATYSSTLLWEKNCPLPWTREPGRLQSMESQTVGYNLETKQQPLVFIVYP